MDKSKLVPMGEDDTLTLTFLPNGEVEAKMDKSKGRLKSVVLGPDGSPVAPPAIIEQLAVERREQFARDRHEVLMTMDPTQWRVFALRWGLAKPPADLGGWDAHDTIIKMMHRLRLEVQSIPNSVKIESAEYCINNGINLPAGMTYDQKARSLTGGKSDF